MFQLPELSYDYGALEPHLDARTMEIHHSKHHQGYISKLNAALENYPDLQAKSVEELLAELHSLPKSVQTAVQNNGGGHANHSLFWSILSPSGGGKPEGVLADAIKSRFGSFADFRDEYNSTAASQFGSGWGWLVVDKSENLAIITTPNQDSPISQGKTPVLGVDVWEHAYYLNYQNRRADYLEAIWNVIDWTAVTERFVRATT